MIEEQILAFSNATEIPDASRLLDVVANDVRLPMASVTGSLELLRNGSLGDLLPHQQRILAVAARNATQLSGMMENVFLVAEIESRRLSFIRQEIGLIDIVEAAASISQQLFVEREHRWKLDFVNGEGFVLADSVAMQRAFTNLIANAAKFTPARGSIRVSVEREYGHFVVSIIDSGIGVPENELVHLGETFFRSSFSKKNNFEGMGLGFMVAKTIIERHDGTVEVANNVEGLTVRVNLPYIARS